MRLNPARLALGREPHCTCRTGLPPEGRGGKLCIRPGVSSICISHNSFITDTGPQEGSTAPPGRTQPSLELQLPPAVAQYSTSSSIWCAHCPQVEDSKVTKQILWEVQILWWSDLAYQQNCSDRLCLLDSKCHLKGKQMGSNSPSLAVRLHLYISLSRKDNSVGLSF